MAQDVAQIKQSSATVYIICCTQKKGEKTVNIDQALKKIVELENFILLVSEYETKTFEQAAIKEYVLTENVNQTAKNLSDKGYRINDRKPIGKDISNVIRLKEIDELHKIAKRIFGKSRRKTRYF